MTYPGDVAPECVFPRLHCDCVDCIERRSKTDRALGRVVRFDPRDTADATAYALSARVVRPVLAGIDWGRDFRISFPEPARSVPNRLYGATINHEGDAV